MIKLILNLLEKIPYRTRFGMSLADELKYSYYYRIGRYKNPPKCLCGGKVRTTAMCYGEGEVGWTTECDCCQLLIDED